MKVIISEACDGFTIILDEHPELDAERYWFDQEEDKKNLVNVFKRLGYEAEYEEDY